MTQREYDEKMMQLDMEMCEKKATLEAHVMKLQEEKAQLESKICQLKSRKSVVGVQMLQLYADIKAINRLYHQKKHEVYVDRPERVENANDANE